LSDFCRTQLEQDITIQELSTTGRNWGRVALNGSSLMFLVDNKVMFEVPLPDVSQAQQAKVGADHKQLTAVGWLPRLHVLHGGLLAWTSLAYLQ
jgi:hypothetical protein